MSWNWISFCFSTSLLKLLISLLFSSSSEKKLNNFNEWEFSLLLLLLLHKIDSFIVLFKIWGKMFFNPSLLKRFDFIFSNFVFNNKFFGGFIIRFFIFSLLLLLLSLSLLLLFELLLKFVWVKLFLLIISFEIGCNFNFLFFF